jgi:hypothetical protein
VSSEYVWRMEDVLDQYAAPADPAHPLVCFDEYALALTAPTRPPLPAAPGRVRREDYEYTRHGSANLLACFAPALSWRTITVHAQRTKREFAEVMRALVEEHFPDADTIRVVLDNLNTHTPAALYEVFPPAQARRIAAKLEWHYTPKHGSWLNMQEIEWAILARQCLDQHLPDQAAVAEEVGAWVAQRNAQRATVDWHFTTVDARRRLQRLYPRLPAPPVTSAAGSHVDLAADG